MFLKLSCLLHCKGPNGSKYKHIDLISYLLASLIQDQNAVSTSASVSSCPLQHPPLYQPLACPPSAHPLILLLGLLLLLLPGVSVLSTRLCSVITSPFVSLPEANETSSSSYFAISFLFFLCHSWGFFSICSKAIPYALLILFCFFWPVSS